jgi:hypothetical protein
MSTDSENDAIKERMNREGIVRHGFNCGKGRSVCAECQELVVAFWKAFDKEHPE